MIIAIVILSLLSIFLIYSTYNLVRKLENYEDSLETSDILIADVASDIKQVLADMRKIDHNGIFEDDDEVGQTFKQILKTIERLERL